MFIFLLLFFRNSIIAQEVESISSINILKDGSEHIYTTKKIRGDDGNTRIIGTEYIFPPYGAQLANFFYQYKKNNTAEIIEAGNGLLKYIQLKKIELDSVIVLVRFICAENFNKIGEFDRALSLAEETQKKTYIFFGEENLLTAISSIEIAECYLNRMEFAQALEYTQYGLYLFEKFNLHEPSYYSRLLSQISKCHMELGDYSKSMEYSKKAINVFGSIDDIVKIETDFLSSSNIYYSILCYSDALRKTGNSNEVLSIDLKLTQYTKNNFGVKDNRYLNSLKNTSFTYTHLGKYSKSLRLKKKVIRLEKKHFKGNKLSIAQSLYSIGLDYYHLRKPKKALKYFFESYKKSIPLRRFYIQRNQNNPIDYLNWENDRISNSNNPDADFLHSEISSESALMICLSLAKENNQLASLKWLIHSYNIKENLFLKNKSLLSNSLKITLKDEIIERFILLSSFSKLNPIAIDFVSKSRINMNGLVNSEQVEIIHSLLTSNDKIISDYWNKYVLLKKQYNRYTELTVEEKNQFESDPVKIENEISNCEKYFSQMLGYSVLARRFLPSNLTNILASKDLFIDIARIPYYSFYSNEWTDSVKYLVFVSNSSDTIVDHFFINEGKELENEIQFDYKSETSEISRATDLKNEIFYNSFWKPIADKIGDAKTVYVSLGGVYNNINLNTLYNPETGKYLLEEKDIRIVNSARDFILMKEREKKQYTSTTSALYGFPDYKGNTTRSADTTDYLAATRDLNQAWIDSLTRGGMKASALPATKVEIEQIAGTFQKNGWKVSTYTGAEASETNIKKEESPRVLHVATHGYFFEDIPLDTVDNRFLGMDRNRVVQDPMLRSGLLFTGANKTLQGEESKGENGLLSAAEAALLDLRETELVVLSACETGKGEVKNSEGVYGLRKAFADAGAQNIIMSLWKVDDKVTQEFMTRFYEIWLNEKTSIREAFNRTQLEIKAKYPQPYYWGAFILVGE